MKIVKELSQGDFRYTFFAWNNKYLIKIEAGNYEQIYKISSLEVSSENDLVEYFTSNDFIQRVSERFAAMDKDLDGLYE